MTLHQMRIFECVVKHLNITKASAALHISQPSVSQQLKLLEDEFAKKFLIRLNQGVELTPEGREFFNAIRLLLAEAENIEQRFKSQLNTHGTVPLIVGGSLNLSSSVLPKLLMAFKKRHPSVQSILETGHTSVIEKRLLIAELEIAIVTSPSHIPEIVYEPYEKIEMVAVCHPSNPLVRKRFTLKELVECPLVLRSGGRIENVLTDSGHRMNVALRCEASSAVKAAVRLGMGVGVLYRHDASNEVASGNIRLLNVPELKKVEIKSFIIHDPRRPLAPMAQEFLKILREKRKPAIVVNEKRDVNHGDPTLSLH